MLRAAIVGLGSWGRTLAGAVAGSADIRFTAAYTPRPAKAQAWCAERGIRIADSYESLLADPAVDAVVLTTPNSLHAAQVAHAAQAGKHVYVEKPLALTVAGARPAVDAVAAAGVTLGAGLNRRFHPSMRELHRRVTSGALGTIGTMTAELTATTGFHRPAGNWRAQAAEEPAGAMASIGVHLVDAMIWMLGRVREIHCVASQRGSPLGKDTTHLLLQFESGVTGQAYCSVAAARNFRVAAYGTQGFAEVLTPNMGTFRFVPAATGRANHLAEIPGAQTIESPGHSSVREALETFARCASAGRPFPVPAADVLHGVEVLEAAVKSAETGRPVAVLKDEG